MENQEMVMEKSWKHILSSLWEPCNVCIILFEIFDLVFKCILFIINMNMLSISIMFPYLADIFFDIRISEGGKQTRSGSIR